MQISLLAAPALSFPRLAAAPPPSQSHPPSCPDCVHLSGSEPAAKPTVSTQPVDVTAQLKTLLPDKPMMITAARAADLKKKLSVDDDQLLLALIGVAKEQARPPISNFLVGAAGRGQSGNIYLGVNLEFPGSALNQTVHGEQFVVTNALRNNEQKLDALAVSAAPCGHCRQWLNELNGGSDLKILIPNHKPTTLKDELPESFGPADLGVTGALLTPQDQHIKLPPGAGSSDPVLTAAAAQAANGSYAPYSGQGSGVAVRLMDGSIYSGKYSENAAFNPSLSPLQGAIIGMVADHRQYSEIADVVLVQREGSLVSQIPATQTLLAEVQPHATFSVALAEPLPPKK